MRRAAKTDANHRTIVAAFKALGCTVRDGSRNAGGWADLAVGLADVTHLVEIKDGLKSPSRRKRTEAQVKWSAGWRGEIVHIVESVDDVQALVKAWRTPARRSSPATRVATLLSTPLASEDFKEGVRRAVMVLEGDGPPTTLDAPKRGLAALLGAMPSDVEVDASDWERPRSEGLTRNPLDALNKTRGVVPSDDVLDEPWLPMPHKDSPSLSLPADCGPFCSCTACVAAGGGR